MTLPSESNSWKIKIKTMKEFRIININTCPSSLFFSGVSIWFFSVIVFIFLRRNPEYVFRKEVLDLTQRSAFWSEENGVFHISRMWHFCWAQKYSSSSFCKTANNYLHSLCLEERICEGADASCRGISWENTCPACWGPQSSWQDADHTRKHLKPSPSAAIIQSESSSSAADCGPRWPRRLPELLIASLILWLVFSVSLYK